MSKMETFIVGGKAPEWLVAETASGRIRVIRDEDGEFSHYLVNTIAGVKNAYRGDVLVKQRSGVTVVTGEQAQKYKIVPKKVNKPIEKEVPDEEQDV